MRIEFIFMISIMLLSIALLVIYIENIKTYMKHTYNGMAVENIMLSNILMYIYIGEFLFTIFVLPIILFFKGLVFIHIALSVIITLFILVVGIYILKHFTIFIMLHQNKTKYFYENKNKQNLNNLELQKIYYEIKSKYTRFYYLSIIPIILGSIFGGYIGLIVGIVLSFIIYCIITHIFLVKIIEQLDIFYEFTKEEIELTGNKKIDLDKIVFDK